MAQQRWWESWGIPGLWRRDAITPNQAMSLAADKPVSGKRPDMGKERGASGTEVFGGIITGEEYNDKLAGRQALVEYDKMRKSDAQVRATLQVIKLPLRSAQWRANPPADHDKQDEAIADFVNAKLFDDDAMEQSWDYTLRHILLQLEFGFSILEIIWKFDEKEKVYCFQKLAPRLPRTVTEWQTDPKSNKLLAIQQFASKAGRYEYYTIPRDYAALFTLEQEGDNWEGTSLLRTAYKHWYYKEMCYKIDAVRLDRFGVGIPRAKVTESVRRDEVQSIEKLLKQLRSNERAWLIEPPGVTFDILTVGRGGASELMQSVEHHNGMIAQNILAQFMTMGGQPHGSYGLGRALADMFLNALKGVASGIGGDIKAQLVKPLCDMNFNMNNRQYPSIVATDLLSADVNELSTLLTTLAAGTFVQPDDDIEAMLRKLMGLPPLPEHLKRGNQPPGMPGMPGMPGAPGGPPFGGGAQPPGAPGSGGPDPEAQALIGQLEEQKAALEQAEDPESQALLPEIEKAIAELQGQAGPAAAPAPKAANPFAEGGPGAQAQVEQVEPAPPAGGTQGRVAPPTQVSKTGPPRQGGSSVASSGEDGVPQGSRQTGNVAEPANQPEAGPDDIQGLIDQLEAQKVDLARSDDPEAKAMIVEIDKALAELKAQQDAAKE